MSELHAQTMPSHPPVRRFVLEGAATLVAAGVVGGGLSYAAGLSPWLTAKVVALVGLHLAICAPHLPGHTRPTLGAANRLTLFRGVLVGVVAGFIGEPLAVAWAGPLAGLAFIALALDGVDGALARRMGTASPFGARLDMELDALTVLVLSILTWQLGQAGAWVLIAGAMRYAFGAAAHLWPWLRRPLYPSRARRVVCGVQVGALALCLVPAVAPPVSTAIAAAAVGALCWSFGRDTRWLFRNR